MGRGPTAPEYDRMIDTTKLKELIQLMVDNDLAEVDLQDEHETVTIKRSTGAAPSVQHTYAPPPALTVMPAHANNGSSAPAAAPHDASQSAIERPMVGTFYSAPNPDSPPFLTPGSQVSAGQVVCIIEAMKVFNEIKSEVSGTVTQVLAKNGTAVEFGQKLFLVKPS